MASNKQSHTQTLRKQWNKLQSALSCQCGKYALAESEVYFRCVFWLGHRDTSFRNDSILPVAGSSTDNRQSDQKVIIFKNYGRTWVPQMIGCAAEQSINISPKIFTVYYQYFLTKIDFAGSASKMYLLGNARKTQMLRKQTIAWLEFCA